MNGKYNTQEVSLKDTGHSLDLCDCFLRFLTDTVSYLEKRFASLGSSPLSDFTVFDHRTLPVQRGERAAYGNAEVQRLVDHFPYSFPKKKKMEQLKSGKN